MKKILTILLALVLVIGTMTPAVFAETSTDESLPQNTEGNAFYGSGFSSSPFTTVSTPAVKFADVEAGSWYEAAVEWAVAEGITNGTDSTHFSPNKACTRAEFVTFLWRTVGSPVFANMTANGPYKTPNPFADVDSDDYFAKAVEWANLKEVVTGTRATTFSPNAKVTREQIAVMMYRYMKNTGKDVSVGEDTNILSYEDFFDISEYAIPAIQWAVGADVMNGLKNDLFGPKETATRAQIVTILYRCFAPVDYTVEPGLYADNISQRAVATVSTTDEEGKFIITISHGDSYAITYEWEMTVYQEDGDLFYTDGVERKYEFTDEETEPTITILQENMSGGFEVKNGHIYWSRSDGEYTTDYDFTEIEIAVFEEEA